MSFQAMALAVDMPCNSAGEKLVLLMLANYCNSHTGRCNPSHKRLADECAMGVSTLKRHIAALAELGYLSIVPMSAEGVSLPNQYMLNLGGVGPNRAGGSVQIGLGVGPNRATNQEYNLEVEPDLKATVQPAAARSRFDEFWSAYPNKKGRQDAEKRWKRDKLDAMADSIIDHVRLMQSEDDGWRRGYVPMGSTYLNQSRWTDVPQQAPRERSQQAAPSKGMQAIMNLQASKNERVDANGDRNGIPAAHLPWARQTAGNGSDWRNGVGLDVRANAQSRLGSGAGCSTFPQDVLDHDG